MVLGRGKNKPARRSLVHLALIRLSSLYSLSFFLLLLALAVWVAHWGPVLGMVASPAGLPSSSGTSWWKAQVQQEQRFAFVPGGTVRLAPRSLGKADRYDYYAALCAHFGREPVKTTVLGLRGLAPNGRRHLSGDNMSDYDDTFVVLCPAFRDAREFLGSTHAGQAVSSLSPAGVAQIQPGLYRASPVGEFNGMDAWWLTTVGGDGRIPSWRDADGDGFIGAKELAKTLTATEILFHNGRREDYGTSIGCQVLPPDGMRNFNRTIGAADSFDYVLVDANRPLERKAGN